MRFRTFFILLLLPVWLTAQPGPFGGFTMSFRVYSPKGDMILCGDKSYKVFPTYTSYPNRHYGNLKKTAIDSFHCNNSRFEFTFKSTPTGGNIPEDFLINIIHGKDTMQVADGLHMDSIPFHKGKFRFNIQSVSMYEIKRRNHAKVNNLDWELLEDGQKTEHPKISFLYEGGLTPDDYSWGIRIEKSPDDKGLIAIGRNSDNEAIWKCNNDAYWSKPYEISIWKLHQLVA
ncbi:MAG TPA: hypothetical protein VK808_02095, partial [Bacteroidia bacterium]|nr:hypothetical protein [Bacteroidia bacterium]